MLTRQSPMRYSMLISLFLSYFLILALPIIFGAAIYWQAEKMIEDEVNSSNAAMLEQSRQALDVGLQDIDKLVSQIEVNKTIRALTRIDDRTLSGEDYYNVFQAVEDYQYYMAFTGYMDDYFIYLHKIDKVLSKQGLLDRKLYFDSCWVKSAFYNGISYESWSALILGGPSGRFTSLNGNKPTVGCVIYTQPLPASDLEHPDATIVIRLNSTVIDRMLQNKYNRDKRSVVVMDGDNQILFSTGTVPVQGDVMTLNGIGSDNGLSYSTYDGVKYAVSFVSSKVAPWKYISLIPFNVFWGKVESIRLLTILCASICLIMGLATAYLLARKNYMPVRELMALLGSRLKSERSRRQNEYKIIKDAVSETMDENAAINKKLMLQNQMLRSNFLAKLLRGKLDDQAYILMTLHAFDIAFSFEHFMVILVSRLDSRESGSGPAAMPADARGTVVEKEFEGIIREAGGSKLPVYGADVEDMQAFLVNLENPEPDRQSVIQAVRKAQGFVSAQRGMDTLASVSNAHRTVYGIPEAYQEALDAIEYVAIKLPDTGSSIALYENVQNLDGRYDYDLETERRLANLVKAGDYTGSRQVLDGIWKTNFIERNLSGNSIKSLMLDISNTILKAVSETSVPGGERQFRDIESLLQYEKLHDIESKLNEILRSACDRIKTSRKSKRSQLVENVIAYIEEKHSDKNFCLAAIGDRFGMSAEYIAKLFRDQTGECLNDFISKARIEESKQLLRGSDLSIKEIADRIGYLSSNVFIRAFKKHEGITPGIYKGCN